MIYELICSGEFAFNSVFFISLFAILVGTALALITSALLQKSFSKTLFSTSSLFSVLLAVTFGGCHIKNEKSRKSAFLSLLLTALLGVLILLFVGQNPGGSFFYMVAGTLISISFINLIPLPYFSGYTLFKFPRLERYAPFFIVFILMLASRLGLFAIFYNLEITLWF